jgi:hypothetical protein
MPASADVLDRLPILDLLRPELRTQVREAFEPTSVAFGDDVVREGDESDAFYVIAHAGGACRGRQQADLAEAVSRAQNRERDLIARGAQP